MLYDEKTNRLDVNRCLAEANLVKGDLLEILAAWPDDGAENRLRSRIGQACLELLVPLTWPVDLDLKDDKYTVNTHRHMPFLQLAQVGYKRAILHYDGANILRTTMRVGLPSMAQPRRERSKRDEKIIDLLLYFFRNMALISQPQHLPSQGDENEISRSSTVDAFHSQDIFQLLLTIGSSMGDEFTGQDVVILEIMFHLLKGVDAKKLFMQKEQVADEETKELKMLIQKEKAMLSGYNKHAPTRHNRFGTMLWVKRDEDKFSTVTGQNVITNEAETLHKMDKSKKWNKPKYKGKLVQDFSEHSDFGMRTDLTDGARKYLRAFVEDFLDSSFNPLFSHLRKAIEREADRVQEVHRRQYFYLISWFLQAECARRDQVQAQSGWNADRPTQANAEHNTFAYIAAVLDQETFVLLNRSMQKAFDEKSWQDLQSTILCFTQILLTVQSMSDSPDEGDQEIAENIQSRIFYEEETHDRIVQLLRGYTNQGFAYLDAVTECVHVFVRLLERFSKQNVDLQVRSKRRARKARKRVTGENGQEDQAEVEEDVRDAQRAVSERKFDFARFAAKFTSQPCVNTFVALLHYHRDLSPAQLKRCHRYFYRVAFKQELCLYLFRVDILQLLYKIVKGPDGLPQEMEGFKDWEQLIQQIFRRCVKWLEKPGMCEVGIVEMLFSKIPGTVFYLQNGYEREIIKRAPRPPAELEVKPGMTRGEQLGVAVNVMINQGKADALVWVKEQLTKAAEERQAWEDEETARKTFEAFEVDTDTEDIDKEKTPPPTILVSSDNDQRKESLFKDKHLRLLLGVLDFQRLGASDDVDASWVIPSTVTAAQLKEDEEQIRKCEFDPPTYEDGKNAEDFLRNKSAARRRNALGSDSDSSGGSDIDEPLFPAGGPTNHPSASPRPKKRKRLQRRGEEFTEEESALRAEERKRREMEKNLKIKSQLFVTASDDESDEERDAEFFRLEEARRAKMRGINRNALGKQDGGSGVTGDTGKKKGKRKAHGGKAAKRRKKTPINDNNALLSDGDASSVSSRHSSSDELPAAESTDNLPTESEAEDEDEKETPATSPTLEELTAAGADAAPKALVETSGNAVASRDVLRKEPGSDDEDAPVTQPVRRNVRAGFIIDSDSE